MANPPHSPTEKDRKTVEAMSSYGIPQSDIALVLGIDGKTLRKHYRHELDTAEAKANAQVAQSLYKKATKGEGAASVTAAIFWLKTRAKWRETPQQHEITGRDGGAIETKSNVTVDWSKLDPADRLRVLKTIVLDDNGEPITEGDSDATPG